MVMAEDDLADPKPVVAEPPEERTRRWPLISGIVIVLAITATALVQFLSAPVALVVAGCTAGAAVLGVVVWRLPQLRKHFGLGRARSGRRFSFGMKRLTGGRRSGTGLKLPKLGGRGGGKGLGRGKGLPKLGGRSGGKSLTGRAKGLGRALAGKGRGLSKSLTGKAKGLGRALTGKGRAGAKGKGLPKLGGKGGPKLPGMKADGRRGIGTRLRGLLPKGRGKTGTGPKAGGKTGGRIRRTLGRFRRPAGKKGPGAKTWGGPRVRGALKGLSIRRAIRALRNRKRGKQGAQRKTPLVKPGEWVLLPAVPFIALVRWLRRRRKRGQGGDQAEPAAPAEQAPAEPAAPPERHPGPAMEPGESSTTRRNPMSIDAVTEALDSNVGNFEPENVADLQAFLSGLPRMYESQASALTRLAERFCDELPIDAGVGDSLRELASRAAGDGDLAADLIRLFSTRHEEDLNRLDNPRPGEQFMDYGNQ